MSSAEDPLSAYGFTVEGEIFWRSFAAKPGSHDDGGHHGPYLGGLGAGSFSRDLYGRFSRWSLQPGYHLQETIPQAQLLCRWKCPGEAAQTRFIGIDPPPAWEGYTPSFAGFCAEHRSYAALFPEVRETYRDPELPFILTFSYWSPLLFDSESPASLPVIFFSVAVENTSSEALEFDAALFWPNLMGWKIPRRTAVDQGGRAWPGQGHAGNTHRLFEREIATEGGRGLGVIQTRRPEEAVRDEMEGEAALAVTVPEGGRCSSELCMKADQNAIGAPAARQKHTQGWGQEYFARCGELPGTGERWRAHWHEPLSAAVHGGMRVAPGRQAAVDFTLALDFPLLVFGEERVWEKKYTQFFGAEGRHGEELNRYAIAYRAGWYTELRDARARLLARLEERRALTLKGAGALLNELFFLTGGGSAWTRREHDGGKEEPPDLGGGEHFAVLEGFDSGYYYYNTLDLWIYAFPALTAAWPRLAELVFDDYVSSARVSDPTRRIVYREMERRPVLEAAALPHDLGTPMEDPWHRLNGYTMRDDPNIWKDRTPSFVIAFYLYTQLRGAACSDGEWRILKTLGERMLRENHEYNGLPVHRHFGDSTWDALQLQGLSIYSAGLAVAAYAALEALAGDFGEPETARSYGETRRRAAEVIEGSLWNGTFYATDSEGRYRSCIMTDALIGPYYASLAGLGPQLSPERIDSHLRRVYDYNFLGYAEGGFGPLLVNDGGSERFSPDGGEELQVNEVIVGSAWLYAGILDHFGLSEQALCLTEVLREVQYERSGLQFRTPAAWSAEGLFRAPLNLRPLSMWFLLF